MLRQPRKPPTRCTCGTCKVCSDGLVVDWANDRRERDSGWQTTDLNRGPDRAAADTAHHTAPPDRQPTPTWPDINRRHTAAVETFEARMEELIRQVRGDG